jgi:ubiquinone/menaquinone biosynthesis C-methylase UbiE
MVHPNATAEEIPLPNRNADTVLVTFTLCTLPNVRRALREMARVLKSGGELVFCEHGLAPDENVRPGTTPRKEHNLFPDVATCHSFGKSHIREQVEKLNGIEIPIPSVGSGGKQVA